MCFGKQVRNRESLFSRVFFKIPFRINYYLKETKYQFRVVVCTAAQSLPWAAALMLKDWMSWIKIRT